MRVSILGLGLIGGSIAAGLRLSGFCRQIVAWYQNETSLATGLDLGLIDEKGEGGWRVRKAFEVLEVFLRELGSAIFVEKMEVAEGVFALRFEREKDEVVMMWNHGEDYPGPWPVSFDKVLNDLGDEIELGLLGEDPVYLIVSS